MYLGAFHLYSICFVFFVCAIFLILSTFKRHAEVKSVQYIIKKQAAEICLYLFEHFNNKSPQCVSWDPWSWEPLVYKVSFDQCKFNITRAATIGNDKLSAIKLISICWLSILSSQLLKCDSFVVSLLHHGSKMNVYVKTAQQDI